MSRHVASSTRRVDDLATICSRPATSGDEPEASATGMLIRFTVGARTTVSCEMSCTWLTRCREASCSAHKMDDVGAAPERSVNSPSKERRARAGWRAARAGQSGHAVMWGSRSVRCWCSGACWMARSSIGDRRAARERGQAGARAPLQVRVGAWPARSDAPGRGRRGRRALGQDRRAAPHDRLNAGEPAHPSRDRRRSRRFSEEQFCVVWITYLAWEGVEGRSERADQEARASRMGLAVVAPAGSAGPVRECLARRTSGPERERRPTRRGHPLTGYRSIAPAG